MFNLEKAILANRATTSALKVANFNDNADYFKKWKSDVENVRLAVSNYAVANREDKPQAEIIDLENAVFKAYKAILAYFTDKTAGVKIRPLSTDLNSLLTIIGADRRVKDSTDGKTFMPKSSAVFRKSVEDFISDRIKGVHLKTAEVIEAERKAKKEAEKAERKAKAEKAKAEAEKIKADTKAKAETKAPKAKAERKAKAPKADKVA